MIDVLLACASGLAVAAASRLSCFSPVARAIVSVVIFAALICGPHPVSAQFAQQGPKLVGTGAVGVAGGALQGWSVALSSDGNTALVGGPDDNLQNDHAIGAAWVFTRSNGAWIQQGQKLVGTGASANSGQGWSVALSGDGNTALIAGPNDRTAWAFTRSNGVWTQQAQLFNASGAVSVTLSADGNTAVIGAPGDNVEVGAAWVFTRSNGEWTQGQKLAANDEAGQAGFGQWSRCLPTATQSSWVAPTTTSHHGRGVGVHTQQWSLDAARGEADRHRRQLRLRHRHISGLLSRAVRRRQYGPRLSPDSAVSSIRQARKLSGDKLPSAWQTPV
jgi:hypothetical protein